MCKISAFRFPKSVRIFYEGSNSFEILHTSILFFSLALCLIVIQQAVSVRVVVKRKPVIQNVRNCEIVANVWKISTSSHNLDGHSRTLDCCSV